MRRALPGFAAVALLATFSPGVPARAAPNVSADVAKAPESVEYLVSTYGVTPAEAVRRLRVQAASPEIGKRLRRDFPDRYAGMWLDQAHGGELVVAMTTTDRAEVGSRLPDFAHFRVRKASYSLATLEAARARITPRLGAGESAVVDTRTNRLTVYPAATATGTKRARALDRMAATETGVVVVPRDQAQQSATAAWIRAEQTTVQRPTAASALACDVLICGAAPMRGGYRLDVSRDDGGTGPCTAGFTVKDSSNWLYVITAGHCFNEDNHRNIDTTQHNGRAVGFESGALTSAAIYPYDYAISPYQTNPDQASYWGAAPGNLVHHECASSHVSCVSQDWPVLAQRDYGDIMVGDIACRTGSADTSTGGAGWITGTYCGEVTGRDGGIVTNLCSRKGDSGGPLYSQFDNAAYGVLHGGSTITGPCNGPDGTTAEYSNFTALSEAFAQARSRFFEFYGVDRIFGVNTSASGVPVRDSIGAYRGSTATFYLDENYDGVSEHQIVYGQSGDLPVSGDFDGVGGDGIGLYRPSTHQFYLDDDNDGATDEWVSYGVSGDQPIAGNWDGSGSTDGVGLFRGSAGRFYLDENNDGVSDHSVAYGTSGDLPVAGNWDGVGGDGVGVFRPSEGRFYLDNSYDGGTDFWVTYGQAGDLPVAGDWDGDGRDGIGVFRPSEGRFYLDENLDGKTDYWIYYGKSGDRPLSRALG